MFGSGILFDLAEIVEEHLWDVEAGGVEGKDRVRTLSLLCPGGGGLGEEVQETHDPRRHRATVLPNSEIKMTL